MPKSDRKPNPKVSEFENSKTMEYCKNCGTLIDFGTRCIVCRMTYEEDESKYTKYVKTSDNAL